ncbi:cyanophycinase [Paenibacillaceae bacterium GAS479]|nr:cyanophycinase [Paenibacillaceae bacterium GAS479]
METHLFLFGGGPPFCQRMSEQFSELAGGAEATISIVCMDRPNWQGKMPFYTEALRSQGVTRFHFLALPTMSEDEAIAALHGSSGIIIGGGDTNRYADCIVETRIGPVIAERFGAGVPVAGFSAGALLSGDRCLISPKDNDESIYQDRRGLGLVHDVSVAVHYSQWQEEEQLRGSAARYPDYRGHYGLDEDCGLYFRSGELERTEGNGVFVLEDGLIARLK